MSYDGDFDGDVQRDLEKAVIDAAVEYYRYHRWCGERLTATETNFCQSISTYLGAQNKVKEIEPLREFKPSQIIPVDPGFIKEGVHSLSELRLGLITDKLNEVIAAINEMRAGK